MCHQDLSQDGVTRLEFTVNTKNSPYKVDIASPALTEYIGSDRMFLVLGVKPFTELTLETSYENLKLEVLHDKNSAGRKMSVEMMRGGVKEVDYKLDVDYDQVTLSSCSVSPERVILDRRCPQHSFKIEFRCQRRLFPPSALLFLRMLQE